MFHLILDELVSLLGFSNQFIEASHVLLCLTLEFLDPLIELPLEICEKVHLLKCLLLQVLNKSFGVCIFSLHAIYQTRDLFLLISLCLVLLLYQVVDSFKLLGDIVFQLLFSLQDLIIEVLLNYIDDFFCVTMGLLSYNVILVQQESLDIVHFGSQSFLDVHDPLR